MGSENVIFAEPGAAEPPLVTVDGLIGSAVRETFADWSGLLIYSLPLIALGLLHAAISFSGVLMPSKEPGSLVAWWFPLAVFFWLRRIQLGAGAEWREPDAQGKLKLTTLPVFRFLLASFGYFLCVAVIMTVLNLAVIAIVVVFAASGSLGDSFSLSLGEFSFSSGDAGLRVELVALPLLAIGIILSARVMSVFPSSTLGRRGSHATFRKTDWKGCLRLGISVLAINLPWLLIAAARTEGLLDNVEAMEGGPLFLAALHAGLFLLSLLISARCIVTVFGLQSIADPSDPSAPPSAP